MSSILRRSAGLTRAASRSLNLSARTTLRSPRLLRTTPQVWAAQDPQSRYYASTPSPRKGAKPQMKNPDSPGPIDPDALAAAEKRYPLPEGWVYLTERQIKKLEAFSGNTRIPIPGADMQVVIHSIRQCGCPKILLELIESDGWGIRDVGKMFKAVNQLASHVAHLESQRLLADTYKKSGLPDEKPEPKQPAPTPEEPQEPQSRQESKANQPGKDAKAEPPKESETEPPKADEPTSKGTPKNSQSGRRPPRLPADVEEFLDNRRKQQGSNKQGKSGENENGNSPSPLRNTDLVTTILGAVTLYWLMNSFGPSDSREITWQELKKNFLDKGLVEKMVVVGHQVRVELNQEATRSMYPESPAANPGFHYYFSIASVDGFERRLEDAQNELGIASSDRIPVSYASESGWGNVILAFGPTLLLVWFFVWASRRGPGGGGAGGVFGFGKSKAKRFSHETAIKVKFNDVAGLDEAKTEILEFVEFLKKPEKFIRLGAKIPRGAILAGPPGTGKTLLAKATAGESGVPFFSVSGSEFVEMFVGVGASRVRDLFATARKSAPCIIFIDEIDAIGKSRADGKFGGGNDEREATLNQILTEMDGFNTTEQVVVLAGTNRVDILDKALMRPGRFDRHINIDAPTMKGRQDIFKVYLKKIVTNEEMEFLSGRLASLTPGFAGADIANCVNEAALIGARANAPSITLPHFEQAIERVISGLERKSLVLNPVEKKTVAYHEAGHAICGWFLEHADPLLKVSIIPRGKALGYAQYLGADVYLSSQKQLMDRMAMTLGGRISEELHFPTITSGASDDFNKVTRTATAMVTQWGMSERVGPLFFEPGQNYTKPFSESTAQVIDEEVRRIVDDAYKLCKDLLMAKKKELGLIAEELLKKEVLLRDDMVRILGPRPFEDKTEFAKYFGETAKDPTEPPKTPDLPDAPEPPAAPGPPAPATFQSIEDNKSSRL